jgi:hypothetical protein
MRQPSVVVQMLKPVTKSTEAVTTLGAATCITGLP